MKTLINRNRAPVGGWRFEDPDTGYKYDRSYKSYKDLVSHIFKYRQMNNLSALPNVDALVFDWLCNQKDMEEQCCDSALRPRTWKETFKGAKQTLKSAILGLFCSQVAAEKRAAVCVKCPYNQFKKEDIKYYNPRFIFTVVHGRSVANQNKLYTCAQCNCILAVKVHHTIKEIRENLEEPLINNLHQEITNKDGEKFFCWQLKDFE